MQHTATLNAVTRCFEIKDAFGDTAAFINPNCGLTGVEQHLLSEAMAQNLSLDCFEPLFCKDDIDAAMALGFEEGAAEGAAEAAKENEDACEDAKSEGYDDGFEEGKKVGRAETLVERGEPLSVGELLPEDAALQAAALVVSESEARQ